MNQISIKDLKKKAIELRINTLKTWYSAKVGHIGGCLSIADILACLYFKYLDIDVKKPNKLNRDRLILSKGHAGLSYLNVLGMKGFISLDEVNNTINKLDTKYNMQPDCLKVNGCDCSSGSLGLGLSIGVGEAIGLKYQNLNNKVVVIVGDGEMQEGSNFEALLSAAKYKLDNLILIIDQNHYQIDGLVDDVMSLKPLDKKLKSFGFKVYKCNGNKMRQVDKTLNKAWNHTGSPICIIADTIKAFGAKGYESKAFSHYSPFKEDIASLDEMIEYARKNGGK